MKTLIISSLIALMSCSVYVKPVPTHAEVYVEKPIATLYVETAPPPVRIEPRPAPRTGYVWVNGYWHWSGRSWVWIGGRWEVERVGYVWVAPRYETHQNKKVYIQGRWEAKPGYKTNSSYHKGKPNKSGYKAGHDDHHKSDKHDKKKKSKR